MLYKIHVASVLLSLTGFVIRGALMLLDSPLLHSKVARIFPHVVDTILLVSGISLIVTMGYYPWEQPWLAGKIILLLAYIVVGTVALKRGKTKAIRTVALAVALGIFAVMLMMARTRQLPF